MTRIARIVVPGLPHHVTQRGNVDANVDGAADMSIRVIGTALAADDFSYSIFGI
ncbi:MAG: hypothetical protein ACKVP5_21455 [Aestuariivirga sp.]